MTIIINNCVYAMNIRIFIYICVILNYEIMTVFSEGLLKGSQMCYRSVLDYIEKDKYDIEFIKVLVASQLARVTEELKEIDQHETVIKQYEKVNN